MNENKIFADNLNRLLEKRNIKAVDVANAIGVSKQVISTWTNGKSMPRFDKLVALANFFGVEVSELVDEPKDELLAESFEEAFTHRAEIRMLFSIVKDATKEEIEQTIKIIEALRK